MVKEIVIHEGQIWLDSSFKEFMILHVYKDDQGHDWVHYRCNDKPCQEYSCWIESFLERFSRHSQ
jgi:hypothetical protein